MVMIGSGDALMLNRRQAITWDYDAPVHWRKYDSPYTHATYMRQAIIWAVLEFC